MPTAALMGRPGVTTQPGRAYGVPLGGRDLPGPAARPQLRTSAASAASGGHSAARDMEIKLAHAQNVPDDRLVALAAKYPADRAIRAEIARRRGTRQAQPAGRPGMMSPLGVA